MMKKTVLAVVLALCVFALAACGGSQQEHFDTADNVNEIKASASTPQPATPTPTPAPTPYDFDTGDYDPTSEEGLSGLTPEEEAEESFEVVIPAATPVSINSEYAGEPPMVIDPIDKPTPSPVPSITYANDDFAVYDATRLRVSFEAPAGWDVDDSISDTYMVTNPDSQMSFQGYLMLTVRGVSDSYGKSALQREVNAVLEALKSGYTNFSPSNFGSRTLLSVSGEYKDFTATIKGTEIQVWGRVQAVYHSASKSLIVLRVVAPLEYKSLYKDTIYPQFRKTLKFTR